MIPNHSRVVQAVYDSGDYDLDTHHGLAMFVDDAVAALHREDPNWVHIKKKQGQKNIHGHGEDSVLYLLPNNQAQGCDFVMGAGAPGAKVGWGPDREPFYTHADGWDAHADWTDEPPPPRPQPPAPSFPYPDENTTVKAFQARVKQAYTDAGRAFPDPNDQDAFRHFTRYGFSCHEMAEPVAADKHIAELRRDLGLP